MYIYPKHTHTHTHRHTHTFYEVTTRRTFENVRLGKIMYGHTHKHTHIHTHSTKSQHGALLRMSALERLCTPWKDYVYTHTHTHTHTHLHTHYTKSQHGALLKMCAWARLTRRHWRPPTSFRSAFFCRKYSMYQILFSYVGVSKETC
jgi:hypothetical protein